MIKELILELGNRSDIDSAIICKVKSVNGLACDCSPVNGDADLLDVKLIADEKQECYLLVPKIGSVVVVGAISREVAYVALVSEVEEVRIKIGSSFLNVKSSGFDLKKGGDSLKDVLTLIVQAIQYIIVMQGRNPDRVKLSQALSKINNIFQ